jgi:hypothetical protein
VVLRVPFEDFPDAVRRLTGGTEVYLAASGRRTLVTAAKGTESVEALSPEGLEPTRARLREAGLTARNGQWTASGSDLEVAELAPIYVGAIAYIAEEGRPGLWVDGFDEPPSPNQVAKALYDEFLGNGEMREVSFEQFMDLAKPSIVVLSPEELRRYAAENRARVVE